MHKADSTFLLHFSIATPRLHSLSLFLSLFLPPTFHCTSRRNVCFLPVRYLKALLLSVLSVLPPQHGSAHPRCFAFICPSGPLHCTFQPFPRIPRHILLICPLCFLKKNSNTSVSPFSLPLTPYLSFLRVNVSSILLTCSLVFKLLFYYLAPLSAIFFFLPTLFDTSIVPC